MEEQSSKRNFQLAGMALSLWLLIPKGIWLDYTH